MGKRTDLSRAMQKLFSGILSALMIASVMVVPSSVLAATSTLTPTDDSYVYEGTNAGANYGSSTTLALKTASGSNRYAFLKFSLSSITSVSSAKLRVYGSASAATTLNAYSTTDSWSESTLTWNNKPATGSLINGVPINTTATYNEIDVTSFVQAQLAGDKIASIVLQETVGKYSTFNSKESASNVPQLVIDQGVSSGDTQPPSAPTNLSATAASSSQINLSWTTSTDNVGVTGYDIYRNGTQVGTSTSTSYSDAGLAASTSYSYLAKARDAAGNVSGASNTATATTPSGGGDTQAPSAPTNLTATAASSSQINLSWTASTDNVGVTGYDIYRNGTQVGTSTSTSYSDSGLAASTSYSYTVKAKDAAGNISGASNTASATTSSSSTNIDYHIWSLQQPNGTTISSSQLVSGYSSAYFYKASDGGQAFMDPKTGSTTSGSTHPRSEMREVTTSGSNAAWSWSGTNTMTNTAAVTLQGGGSSGRTAIGQMFNSSDSIPLVELMYTASPNSSGGNFQILYEEAKGAGSWTYLNTKAALGSKFTYELSLSGGVATVKINGTQVFSKTPSFSGKQFYFKAGNYDQTATSGSVSTTPYTIVEFYSVNVVHK